MHLAGHVVKSKLLPFLNVTPWEQGDTRQSRVQSVDPYTVHLQVWVTLKSLPQKTLDIPLLDKSSVCIVWVDPEYEQTSQSLIEFIMLI